MMKKEPSFVFTLKHSAIGEVIDEVLGSIAGEVVMDAI